MTPDVSFNWAIAGHNSSAEIASKNALNPENTLLSDSNLTWIEFPTEYTGLGMF